MQKDVIYIDVEDDITAIIGKVKDSKEKIVALVPPKRMGVLQSAVNLRLLKRAADQADKRLVLITSNTSLGALAASAVIPVAKNLQSKPELAEVAALDIDDGDDVINGEELPVGELAKTAEKPTPRTSPEIEAAIRDSVAEETPKATPPSAGGALAKPRQKKSAKIPNFNKFRKKLILIILGVVLLIGFLIWAIFFAARATIVITAKTTGATVNQAITLSQDATTNVDTNTVRSLVKEEKQPVSVEFDATGKKEVGETAKGTVRFSTDSISVARQGVTIPAGTRLTASGGSTYTTDRTVVISLDNPSGTSGVTASNRGTKYNGASGSVDGAPRGVSADFTSPTSGGTDKTVKIVTSDDVQRASQRLADQQDDSSMKQKLSSSFGDDATVIDESYVVSRGTPNASPGVGAEADKATLRAEITYSMVAIPKGDLKNYLKGSFEKQLGGQDNQQVYSDGGDQAKFSQFSNQNGKRTVQIAANGQVGPKIDDTRLKDQAKGKRYGEVQSIVESIRGVENVDVQFWPFWVQTVPDDTSRVSVKFQLNESN